MPFIPRSVREFREREGKSIKEFAVDAGVSPMTVRNYERGKSQPCIVDLDKLYTLLQNKGYYDLHFYEPPKVEEGKDSNK